MMRNKNTRQIEKKALLLFFIVSFLFSCTKNEHWFRVRNDCTQQVSLTIGSTSFAATQTKTLTNYKLIDGGVMKFTCSADSLLASDKFQTICDSTIQIAGDGTHYWTCLIDRPEVGKYRIQFVKDE